MPLVRDSLGTWDIDIPVTAPAGVTVTADVVKVAFLRGGKPSATDWLVASWATNTAGQTVARITVGPGQLFVPTAGEWYEWIEITDNPEIPVFCAGTVIFT